MVEKRYALALYKEAKNKEKYQKYLEDFSDIYKQIKISLQNPRVNKKAKKEIIKELSKDKLFTNFLILLLDENRLHLIDNIKKNYIEILNNEKGIINIKIITPYELTKKQIDDIISKYKNKEKAKDVTYEIIVDKTLIGGIKININGKVYDGSLVTKLKEML